MAPGVPLKPLALVATLMLAVLLSGCFGDPQAVYVPDSDVRAGWDHAQDNTSRDAGFANLRVILNEYAYGGEGAAGLYTLGAPDIPFVPEADALEKLLMEYAKEEGITLTKTGEDTMTLDNGQTVDRRTYEIQKEEEWGSAKGEAWILSWDSDDFFGGSIGYATTQVAAAGLLGSDVREDRAAWNDVQAMMKALDW